MKGEKIGRVTAALAAAASLAGCIVYEPAPGPPAYYPPQGYYYAPGYYPAYPAPLFGSLNLGFGFGGDHGGRRWGHWR
jgi:hypothetical protein